MPSNTALGSRSKGVFNLVIGLAIGLLVAALAIPDSSRSVVESAAGGGGAGDDRGDSADGIAGAVDGTGGELSVSEGGAGRSDGRSGTGARADGDARQGTASGGGSDSSSGGGGQARGVTADAIRIGVAVPDIGAVAVVDEFNLGDMRGHMQAILEGWRREGLVPVHGRDVEFVFRDFDIVGNEDVATCNGFVKDDQVFMVIGIRSYERGAECLADRFDTPVVTLEYVSEEGENAFNRMHPWLFTVRATPERIARNWIHWAHSLDLLAGRRIGIYQGPDYGPAVASVERVLAELGYEVAAKALTTSRNGGPDDQVAVQRFRGASVDLVLPMVGALTATSFMEQAEAQAYRPAYIDTDLGDHTSDAGSSTYHEGQYGDTLAMTMTRVGDLQAGHGLSPAGEACVANYERYSGRRIDRSSPESAELVMMLQECDEAEMVIGALHGAGRDLDRFRFVAALEARDAFAGASHGLLDFDPAKHDGAEGFRTVQWLGSCGCWTGSGPFRPLWVG